jgi:hypothetical protein
LSITSAHPLDPPRIFPIGDSDIPVSALPTDAIRGQHDLLESPTLIPEIFPHRGTDVESML